MKRKIVTIPPKLAGSCGLLAPIVGCIFVGLALYHSTSWFSWTDNWISDMGGADGDRPIWSARGTESILLNFGLTMTGLLGFIFSLGVQRIRILDTEWGRRGTHLLSLDMIMLTFVGFFPLTLQSAHYFFALSFFLLTPVSLLAIGKALLDCGSTTDRTEKTPPQDAPSPFTSLELPTGFTFSDPQELGRFVGILGIVVFLFFPTLALPRPWGGNAVVEVLAVIPLVIFSMVFGYGLIKGDFEMIIDDGVPVKGQSLEYQKT